MSGDVVRMPIDAVRGHAGSVDRVADAVDLARGAVRQVSMDAGAYGQLCRFLPGLLEPVFEAAAAVLGGSADALHETAAGLRATADSTQATDTAGARRISAAGPPPGRLPELPL